MKHEKLRILNNVLGRCTPNGEENLFACPKCDHPKRKLSINVEKNVFKCWICDFSGTNISYLIKRYGENTHILDWENTFRVNLSSLESYEDLFREKKEEKEATELSLPPGFISLTGFRKTQRSALNYLQSRGLTRSDILMWKIGYAHSGEYEGRIIIPSFDKSGSLNYYIARSFKEGVWPKYKNPKSSKDVIFNDLMIDWSKPITLVEGVFDAIKAENAIPILGSILREDGILFKKIVEKEPLVYIALDLDAYDKALKISQLLSKYGIEAKIIVLSGKRDIGDMEKSKVKELYNTATDINSENYLLYELQKI